MKILCVHPGYELYGADRSFARTIAALRSGFSSYNIEVLLPQDGPITSLDPMGEVDLKTRPMWILRRRTFLRGLSLDLWRNIVALFAAYRDMNSADIIYINTIVVFDFIFLARFFKKPIVVHVREIPNGIEMPVFRALLRWSRAQLIFNSQATKNAFALPGNLISRVVHNGVRVPEVKSTIRDRREKAQVLMIGRLNHWKGQEILIEAVSKMAPWERERLEVRIVGSTFNKQDDFYERLHVLIEEHSLSRVIKIEPFEADPSASFFNSDLVVVPSRLAEPFGNVAIEAMAFAKPVVASRHGGLSEIVCEEETGRLFEPGNAIELSNILKEFLENSELYRQYGAAGLKRFEQLFTVEEYNKNFVAAMRDLILTSPAHSTTKFLCVHPGYELYGADRCFARAVSALQTGFPQGHMKVVLPQEGPIAELPPLGEVDREIRPLWILRRRTLLRSFTLDILGSIRALVAAYRDMRSADFIYINTIVVFDYILMARFISKPVIVHVHEIPNGIELVIFKMLLLWSRASLIYNSEATRNAFRMPGSVPERVVYNGVDVPELIEQGQLREPRAKVIMLGRLNHWKGQEVLIDAVGQLTPVERGGLQVRIVGGTFNNQDDFRERFERMIKKKQLTDVIRIDPFEPDPSPSYRDCDLVVVPSRLPEPFGCVAIEAMGFSKPVVASRHGGLTEIVREGETGRLFSPGNATELCAVLQEFLANRETYRSYGAAGRRRFEKLFTTEQSNRAFIAAINEFMFGAKHALQARPVA